MLKIGWFSTGRGEGSRALLQLIHKNIVTGSLPASIEFIFCNRDPGETEGGDQFHSLVHSCNLPLVTLSSERFRRRKKMHHFAEVREEFDHEVLKKLNQYSPDIVILAGYMLFTAAELCTRFTLLNMHPAPPGGPIGTWQQVIWRLIEQRAEESGVQMQVATMDWDNGPLISYSTFSISTPDFEPFWKEINGETVQTLKSQYWEELPLFQRIRAEGLKREGPLLIETLKSIAKGDIRIDQHQVLDKEGNPISGKCLSGPIETLLAKG